jgi:purine-nucleoside phosphorylase
MGPLDEHLDNPCTTATDIMLEIYSQIEEAAAVIGSRWPVRPRVGIILGTGLGDLADHIQTEFTISYDQIPHFPKSTAMGHKGQLVCGSLAGVNVVTMEGRFHLYEGYRPAQITLPERVMKLLGIELLIVSNASGGLNPNLASGDIMVIEDHINLMFNNPLIGVNDNSLGPRFPDMSRPYDPKLVDLSLAIARREDFVAHRGIYVSLTGPSYETRAEYRFLRRIGGDVVGMSTVPEVIVAAHAGLRVLALSTVTNMCLPDALGETSGDDVVRIAKSAEPKLRSIVVGVLDEEFGG